MKTPIYPVWICNPCGTTHGNREAGVATWHIGTCYVCGMKDVNVTEPRDFGHLKSSWLVAHDLFLKAKKLDNLDKVTQHKTSTKGDREKTLKLISLTHAYLKGEFEKAQGEVDKLTYDDPEYHTAQRMRSYIKGQFVLIEHLRNVLA
jgi:hypothetical protein